MADDLSCFANDDYIDAFFRGEILSPPRRTTSAKSSAPVPKLNTSTSSAHVEKKKAIQRNFTGTDYVKKYTAPVQTRSLTQEFSGLNITGVSTGLTYCQNDSVDETALFDTHSLIAPSEFSEELTEQRKKLPIYEYREEILANIRKYPVMMISGPTGCGKSTQVPQYIFDDPLKVHQNMNILISQPRKIAAVTLAQRVAQERNESLGKLVGYQVGLDRCINLDEEITQITFCTTGIILQKLLKQKSLARYTHIILDEVHERDLDIDFLITIIRRLQSTSVCTKIILMSATLDAQKFQDYWKIRIPQLENEFFYPPVIDLDRKARRFPIVERYLDDIHKIEIPKNIINPKGPGISNEMYCFAFRLVLLILRSGLIKNPNILIFLPGLPEIERLLDEFHGNDNISKLKKFELDFFILHSSLSIDEQKRVFMSSEKSKIIMSTNIAESSVTIPNIHYVIDFCLTKHLKSCKGSQMSTYLLAWASKNNCKQRAGRTGRVTKGTVFRLVFKKFYETCMPEHSLPDMQLVPLESVVAKIKEFNMGTPMEILANSLDPPDESSIVSAVLCLKEHGGLLVTDKNGTFEYHDGELTFLGEIMSALPCDIRVSKLIVLGYLFSVLDESIIIGAGLNFKGIFLNTLNNRMGDYNLKVYWSDGTGSDCLATYNAYMSWYEHYRQHYFKSADEQHEWCRRQGLDYKNLHEMRIWIDEVKKRLQYYKLTNLPRTIQPLWSQKEKTLILKIIMAGAFGVANFFVTETQIDMERDAFQLFTDFDVFRSVYCRGMDKSIIGDVYKKQLKELLIENQICDESCNVKIEFDNGSERVHIMFEGSENSRFSSGQMAPEVYRAVKFKNLMRKLQLHVMTAQETLAFAVEHSYGNYTYNEFQLYYPSIKHPEHWPYPTRSTVKMSGFVTNVVNCGKFYFCPMVGYNTCALIPDARYKTALWTIKSFLKIFDLVPFEAVENKDNITPGTMFVYKNIEINEKERAEFVRFVNENVIEIIIIDRGIKIQAPIKYIYKVKNAAEAKKLSMYPARVFECRLKEVEPSSVNSLRSKWSEKAINMFNQKVMNKKAVIEIYSVVANIVSVVLKTEDEVETNWNHLLLNLGYAQECEESYASKINHDIRERENCVLREPVDPEEDFKNVKDEKWIEQNEIKTPKKEFCDRIIKLTGPFSPLETSLRALSMDHTGFAKVDSTSVNHVLFNDEILSLHDKFFIAADVSFGAVNRNVKVRETTEMPNIPGLSCLLAMIFSPVAQLRRDEKKTRYISIITGLGLDQTDKKSYFRERDAVQLIDFNLREEDIHDINRLRFWMSKMLHRDPFHKLPNLTDRQREQILKTIQEIISSVINKKREVLDIQTGKNKFNWDIDQEDVIHVTSRIGDGAIWGPIPIPPLTEMSIEMRMQLVQHVEQFEKPGAFDFVRECKLCGKSINNEGERHMHLMSTLHLLRKRQLGIA